MIIKCDCKKCDRTSFVTVDENSCIACFMKENLKPAPIYSKWRKFKKITYFIILLMPVSTLVGLTMGVTVEYIFVAGILLGQWLIPIVNLCMRKF